MNFVNLLKVRIGWKSIFIEFIIVFVIFIIGSILTRIFLRKVFKQYNLMNYEYVLKRKKFLPLLWKRTLVVNIEYIMLAVCSYETGNSSDFEYYIEKVNHKKLTNTVWYWKGYYNFFNGNETEFLNCLEHLKDTESPETNDTYIKILTLLMKKKKNEPISEDELQILSQTVSKKIKDYIQSN